MPRSIDDCQKLSKVSLVSLLLSPTFENIYLAHNQGVFLVVTAIHCNCHDEVLPRGQLAEFLKFRGVPHVLNTSQKQAYYMSKETCSLSKETYSIPGNP
jgi:hypothetical protein